MTAGSISVIIIAFLIGIIYLVKIRNYDIYEKEPFYKLLLVTIGGGFFSIICSLVIYQFVDVKENFTDAIFKVGIIEEFSKLAALLAVYSFIKKDFNEIVDGIIYITAVSLGFSVFENILYSIGSEEPYSLLLRRSVFSVLGHISFSGYMGIAFYIHKRVRRNYTGIILSVALAAAAHGFYDGVLFIQALNSFFLFFFTSLFLLQFQFLRTTLCFSAFRKILSADTFKPINKSDVVTCCRCRKDQISRIYEFNNIRAGICDSCNDMLFDYQNTKNLFRYFRPVLNRNYLKNISQKEFIYLDMENKIYYSTQRKILGAEIEYLGKWLEENNKLDRMKILNYPLIGFILKQLGLKYVEEKESASAENELSIPA